MINKKFLLLNNAEKKTIILHCFFWLAYYCLVYVSDVILDNLSFHADLTFFITQNIFLFYGFFYCLQIFSKKNKITIFWGVMRFFLLCYIYLFLRVFIRHYFLPFVFNDSTWKNFSCTQINSRSALWLANYFLFALGYYFFSSTITKEHLLRLAAQEKVQYLEQLTQLEKDKIEFEQAFLRTQINPHFLYNTLNFLYYEASTYSKKLSEAIYLLSEIMRYSLHEETTQQTKVPLQKEIDYVHNYIRLNQFRFNNRLKIDIIINGDTSGVFVPPMIIMTFIENIIKHGELRDIDSPVKVIFNIQPNNVIFNFINKKKQNSLKNTSTGIGIRNIRKRLTNVYGNKFDLKIIEDDSFYTVSCSIFM